MKVFSSMLASGKVAVIALKSSIDKLITTSVPSGLVVELPDVKPTVCVGSDRRSCRATASMLNEDVSTVSSKVNTRR